MTRPIPVLLVENSIGLSGSTISLCTLLNRLDRSLFRPHVAVSRPEQVDYLRAHLQGPAEVVLVRPRQRAAFAAGARRHRPTVRRALALADLVASTLPYTLALWRFARRRGIALIHQNNGFDEGAVFLSALLRVPVVAYQRGNEWQSPLVRRLATRVSHYFANSEATRASLLALGLPVGRISVVYPPIEPRGACEARWRPVTRDSLGVAQGAPCFGILGQLQAWKGHRVFLRAAQRVVAEMPEARALIVGSAPVSGGTYEAELHALARTLGIADKVVFTGFVEDVPGLLEQLDVVVHASEYPEPFGRVIAEAMVAGRPVIAADAGGPREIITSGRTGLLVPPGDDRALADGLLTLLRDPALARRLAEDGREEALRRFSAPHHARLIQDIYLKIVDGQDDGTPIDRPPAVAACVPAPAEEGRQ